MNAGDGYFSSPKTEISADLSGKILYSDSEKNLIDNNGDNTESVKAWDNNFTERLANFMKNSKSLLENIDKKHPSVKFQNFEKNFGNEKYTIEGLQSPSHTLVQLEESLLQLDDSKSKYIQKNDNKRSTEQLISIDQSNVTEQNNTYNSNISPNLNVTNNEEFHQENNVNSFSGSIFHQEEDTSSTELSLNNVGDSCHDDPDEGKHSKKSVNVRHSRHLTHSGATRLHEARAHLAKVVDFKLALLKKRTNSLRGYNQGDVKRERKDCNSIYFERYNGFNSVINALFNKDQHLTVGRTFHGLKEKEKNTLDEDEIDRLASPFITVKMSEKCTSKKVDYDENDMELDIGNEGGNSFLETDYQKLQDKSSLGSNTSLKENLRGMENLLNQVSFNNSIEVICGTDKGNKIEKSEECSIERNTNPLYPVCIKSSSPVEAVQKMAKRNMDSNEKENISGPAVAEKDISDSQTKKYTTKNYNFQEALRIDELENELNKMKSHIKEKDMKISAFDSDLKPMYKSIVTDVSAKSKEGGVSVEKKKPELRKENHFENKACGDHLINLSTKTHGADDTAEGISLNGTHEYSSIEDYNPNNSSALRNKIKDLESQVQDLQEANENAAHFMMTLKQNSAMTPTDNTNAIISELIDKNQSLREEVDRLRQNIPALKGDAISSQFLRQELENLKEDLYILRHQNNLIVKENIALKCELKKKDSKYDSHTSNEGRKPALYQLSDHIKPNPSTGNDIFELNGHFNDLNDSDLAGRTVPGSNLLQNQSQTISGNHPSKDITTSQKQSKHISSILPQHLKQKPELHAKKKCHRKSKYGNDPPVIISKKVDRMINDNCPYEKDYMDLSNDSTDSILSDANKEMQEIIFESELDHNVRALSTKSKYETGIEIDLQFDKTVSKKESKLLEDDQDSVSMNKFSTLGKTAYAPRASYEICIGDVVKFIRQGGRISKGLVHFVGPLPNRKDTYLGIELEVEDGKHDGIYEGNRYFQCIKNKGVFVAFNKIIMVYSKKI